MSFDKQRQKWLAQIRTNIGNKLLGHVVDEIDAAGAYNANAVAMFGEYAKLNDISD